jgi:hypothetical protein
LFPPTDTDKMPRNTTGGSGHKAQRNSEGSKARHNREFIDDLLDDYRKGEKVEDVYVGRVVRRMGCGRMEVFYIKQVADKMEDEESLAFETPVKKAPKIRNVDVQQIIPMRGGLRGKAKKTVWVDIDSLVMIAETGLSGTTHEIVAVFSPEQVARYRKLFPQADERLFLKGGAEATAGEQDAIIFDASAEDEVDVDDI